MVSSFWYGNTCNSLTIPADGDSAVSVGAAFWNEDGTAPLYGLETFSSCGPRNAAGGAQPVGAVNKPDVVAPDGVSTASYGASNGANYANGGSGFWGTSARRRTWPAWPRPPGRAVPISHWPSSAVSSNRKPSPKGTVARVARAARRTTATATVGSPWAHCRSLGCGTAAERPITGPRRPTGMTASVPGVSTPILFNATSTKNATVNGNITAASLTLDAGYTGAVTLGGDLTVSGDVTLNSGTLDVSTNNYPISIGGNFARTGGTFTPRGGTVTFNGAGTKSITGDTAFNNVVVGSGLTLATSNNVTVGGAADKWRLDARDQSGRRRRHGEFRAGEYRRGCDDRGHPVEPGRDSSRSELRRRAAPIQTGKYWTITPTGGGYGATVTLPHAGLADPSVCRNMGDWWDCAHSQLR